MYKVQKAAESVVERWRKGTVTNEKQDYQDCIVHLV
jgi:hypothetical protein